MRYGRRTIKKKRRMSSVKITREDIEKAMKEFKGEIKRIKPGEDSFDEAKPIKSRFCGIINF